MRSKTAAILLALFLGALGAHKFYLGEHGKGVLFFPFSWTGIPAICAFIDFILLLLMSEETFNARYNAAAFLLARPAQAPSNTAQSVVVNIQAPPSQGGLKAELTVSGELRELAALRDSGALTEEEFQQQKRKLLTS